MNEDTLKKEILDLKEQTNSIILAHFYQTLDIQSVGDFLGDSLGLSRKAITVQAATNIIFSAVDFMAEVASILNPSKKVYVPEPTASCPMANMLDADKVRQFKERYLDRPVVLYVNTLAEAKAECDVICTSANATTICKRISEERGTNKLLFGPDKNLAYFIEKKTGLDIVVMPEKGCCYVHNQFILEDVNLQRKLHPRSKVIVHPECKPEVQDAADFIGSTSQMIAYVKGSSENEF
ncbi:MAG: quinolinate synthase, partial [Promethearchaeota archaeon]